MPFRRWRSKHIVLTSEISRYADSGHSCNSENYITKPVQNKEWVSFGVESRIGQEANFEEWLAASSCLKFSILTQLS